MLDFIKGGALTLAALMLTAGLSEIYVFLPYIVAAIGALVAYAYFIKTLFAAAQRGEVFNGFPF